ncbi:Multiple epidermal growth factor-like domains protein 9, partial [Varanus komodoensis]
MKGTSTPLAFNLVQGVFCNCSSTGSTGRSDCNITTGQCECRPGFAGLRCERCEEGFSLEPRSGRCLACGCHAENAVSPSCDASGRCECKAGATGLKCGECREGYSKFNGTSCELCQCGNHSARCNRLT